jgi:hypothetical protein
MAQQKAKAAYNHAPNAERQAEAEKTNRLRALRLAKEAADKEAAASAAAAAAQAKAAAAAQAKAERARARAAGR